MEKTIRYSLAIFILAIMTACDPGFDDNLVIVNQSGYDLIIDYGGDHRYCEQQGSCNVLNGDIVKIPFDGGIGCTNKESSEMGMLYYFWGDSVVFMTTDSIVLRTYYATDTTSDDSPYNFNSSHYTYEEKTARNGCPAYYTKHTFTLTAEQLTPLTKQ